MTAIEYHDLIINILHCTDYKSKKKAEAKEASMICRYLSPQPIAVKFLGFIKSGL